jgi:hypothetical protein
MELLGFLKILEGHEALDSKFAYIVSYSCIFMYLYTHSCDSSMKILVQTWGRLSMLLEASAKS